jgi:hypothetical protein
MPMVFSREWKRDTGMMRSHEWGRHTRFFGLLSVAALLAMTNFGTTAVGAEPPHAVCPTVPYLAYVNSFRVVANLPLLTEDTAQLVGDCDHSRYVVKNSITHVEDPNNPWYTAAGAAAGQRGNVATATGPFTYQDAINNWMTGPFHAIGILDPRLTQTAFGIYSEGSNSGATLDVFDINLSFTPTTPTFYPADHKVMPLTSYGGFEAPDPLAPCAGYTAPTGAPIILQTVNAPDPASGTLSLAGLGVLPSCVYTGATYPPEPFQGSQILSSRNAVVLIPRDPLTNGIYTVSISANGGPYAWTFAVGLQSITVSPPSVSATAPGTQQFTATGNFAPGNGIMAMDLGPYVTWTSTNPTTASVNATGLATLHTLGSAAITASYGSISGAATYALPYTLPGKPSGGGNQGNPAPAPGQRPGGNPNGNPNPLPPPR